MIRLFRFPNTFSYVQRDAVLIFVLSLSQKVGSAQFCCKIQICNLGNGALPTFWPQLYVRKVLENRERWVTYRHSLGRARFVKYRFSPVHILHFLLFPCFFPRLGLRIITASCCFFEKCSRMGRDFSCLSLQSSKSSFRKIQIFDSVYSALPLFLSLFRVQIITASCCVNCIRKLSKNGERLVASRGNFRKIQIFEFAFSTLPLFYSLFRVKIITASCCIHENWHIITVFAKYRFSNLHIFCTSAVLFLV